jgi:hypothetical protein
MILEEALSSSEEECRVYQARKSEKSIFPSPSVSIESVRCFIWASSRSVNPMESGKGGCVRCREGQRVNACRWETLKISITGEILNLLCVDNAVAIHVNFFKYSVHCFPEAGQGNRFLRCFPDGVVFRICYRCHSENL